MDILEEIERILRERNIVSEYVSGFDEKEQRDWHVYDLTVKDRKMALDICSECTIFFEDWHGHYNPENDRNEFVRTLNGIFDNELCALGAYIGSVEPQNAGTAMLARREDVNEEYIIDELGTGKIIRCCFFDPSLNREYRV